MEKKKGPDDLQQLYELVNKAYESFKDARTFSEMARIADEVHEGVCKLQALINNTEFSDVAGEVRKPQELIDKIKAEARIQEVRKLQEQAVEAGDMIGAPFLRLFYEFEFPEYWRLGRIKDNPYYAIQAYNLFRKHNKPLPEWVLRYLDQLVNGEVSLPTMRDIKNAKTLDRKIKIALEARDMKEKTGDTWVNIEAKLAEKHSFSMDEIRKYRSTLKHFFDFIDSSYE